MWGLVCCGLVCGCWFWGGLVGWCVGVVWWIGGCVVCGVAVVLHSFVMLFVIGSLGVVQCRSVSGGCAMV